jgi:hypothetical protein
MIRHLICITLCTLLFGCATAPTHSSSAPRANLPAGSIVLRIEVLENQFTGLYPPSDCPEGQQCIQFYGWSKYRARVRAVAYGQWDQPEVSFARLEHASYTEKFTRDCYVILRPASASVQSLIGVKYVASDLLSNSSESHRAKINDLLKDQ